MWRIKALAPWDGKTLLDAAINQASSITDCVAVAVGAGDPLVRCRIRDRPRYWCRVGLWQKGQSESLKAGLRFLRVREAPTGILVMLVDQPLIPREHLQALAAEAARHPGEVIATRARGRAMAPAYLPRKLWPQLNRLTGDRGAGAIINRARSIQFPCDQAALDVDTLTQLHAAREI